MAVLPNGDGVLIGAGDLQGGAQGDSAPLHAFDNAPLPLVEQVDNVLDVLVREARLLDDDLGARLRSTSMSARIFSGR